MELAWLRLGAHVALILLANVLIAVLLATRGRIGRIPHYPLATAALILFAFWLIGLALSVRGLAFSVRGDIVPFLVATEAGAACLGWAWFVASRSSPSRRPVYRSPALMVFLRACWVPRSASSRDTPPACAMRFILHIRRCHAAAVPACAVRPTVA